MGGKLVLELPNINLNKLITLFVVTTFDFHDLFCLYLYFPFIFN